MSKTPAFVRTEQIPPKAPPISDTGVVKWVRENLFNGVSGSILTVLSLIAIYYILAATLPWLLNGVWSTNNIRECREVLDGATGACFSVLSERYAQLLYGIAYPADAYWRPTLAFVLLFVAAAPVLFFKLPRILLVFTAIYPFLAFWLIWGGAFWVPLLLIAGFIIAYLAYRFTLTKFGDGPAIGAGAATLLIWMVLIMGLITSGLDRGLGSARMESKRAELQQITETLPARIETLTLEADALANEISAQVDDARATNDLENLRAAFRATSGDRRALNQLRRTIGGLTQDLSAATNLLDRIDRLPDVEAELPEKRADAFALRNALPDSVADVDSSEALEALVNTNREENLGIPSEHFEAIEDVLEAESAVRGDELLIERTYEEVARIGLEPVASRDMGGFMLNMILGTVCVSLSLPIGIALALGRQSSMPLIKGISVVFIEFIRGVPLITLLFVANVILGYFFPPETNLDLILRVIIMITMFASAYIAEVIRGGLAAQPRGQYEAADSLGLDYAQAMRLIILPQALKISIPGIVNVAVGLFKDTTLVSVISMFDLVGMIRGPILASTDWNGVYWELWLFAALLFFVICYGISQYSQWLERQLATDHR